MLIANPPLFSEAQKAKIFEWIRNQASTTSYNADVNAYMGLGT